MSVTISASPHIYEEGTPTADEKKRLDIRDVARHAGVSIATVSRTVNAVPTVDKELAARVHRAIQELNYYPNKPGAFACFRPQPSARPPYLINHQSLLYGVDSRI